MLIKFVTVIFDNFMGWYIHKQIAQMVPKFLYHMSSFRAFLYFLFPAAEKTNRFAYTIFHRYTLQQIKDHQADLDENEVRDFLGN